MQINHRTIYAFIIIRVYHGEGLRTNQFFAMDIFEEDFRKAIKRIQNPDEQRSTRRTAFDEKIIHQSMDAHRRVLQGDSCNGQVCKADFKNYTNVMSTIHSVGGVPALMICMMLYVPGEIFTLRFVEQHVIHFWQPKSEAPEHSIREAQKLEKNNRMPEYFIQEAQELAEKYEIIKLLAGATKEVEADSTGEDEKQQGPATEAKVNTQNKSSSKLSVPQQPGVSRRSSISRIMEKVGRGAGGAKKTERSE